MPHLFTYGSLMFNEVWSSLVRTDCCSSPATLHGYKRSAMLNESYPGIFQGRTDDSVQGVVYFDLTESDLQLLDDFEGEYYSRDTLQLSLPDKSGCEAEAYVIRECYQSLLTDMPWSPEDFSKNQLHSFIKKYMGFRR
jgi:gamma-glutamylcyclotransferase (GGCT)/AIG2-like uncharacterized protein YtfP